MAFDAVQPCPRVTRTTDESLTKTFKQRFCYGSTIRNNPAENIDNYRVSKRGDIFNRIFFISIHLHKSGFVALIGLGELEQDRQTFELEHNILKHIVEGKL